MTKNRAVVAVLVLASAVGAAVGCSSRGEDGDSTANAVDTKAPGTGLVISQIFADGTSKPEAAFRQDFVEIFNASQEAIPLDGISVQYASGKGEFETAFGFPSGKILEPGQYTLFGLGKPGSGNTRPELPAFTPIANKTLATGAGKLAIVREAAELKCGSEDDPCSDEAKARIIDLVGYGEASAREGQANAPAPTPGMSISRKASGCADSNDNGSDFELTPAAPRNSENDAARCKVNRPGADASAEDAGSAADSGAVAEDAGSTAQDAGPEPTDAGPAPEDASTGPTDAGTTPTDSGTGASDSGTVSGDGGAKDGGGAKNDAGKKNGSGLEGVPSFGGEDVPAVDAGRKSDAGNGVGADTEAASCSMSPGGTHDSSGQRLGGFGALLGLGLAFAQRRRTLRGK